MKKWNVAQLNKALALSISESMDMPMLLSVLLQIRGFYTKESIRSFLSDELNFDDPMLIKDMDKAVDRIRTAIESNEKICVYGDYDADGVTATTLLYSYLVSVGADVMYYIPSRSEEGYGMNIEAINSLNSDGIALIITVDNGISATLEIDYANSLGIDTVITDHHAVPEVLPDAVAVVDPHRDDCESRFKELSGVGVAFKLVMAIEGEDRDIDLLLECFSDIVALGTIGDVVSLTDENRVLVKEGIRNLRKTDRIGLKSLLSNVSVAGDNITSSSIAYSIVPRINAVGRLGSSTKSVELLLTDDEELAVELSGDLVEDNRIRQQIEREILSEIDEMIKGDPGLVMQSVIVIDGENWHQGVIGIVAARIKSIYGKPCIIISREGELARASGRSVEGFSLTDTIFYCSDLLIHFGGHPMAVGFSLESANIDIFKEAIYEYTESLEDIPLPSILLDCKLNPSLLELSLLDSITALEPFGAGNPVPVFGLYNMYIQSIRELSGGKHLRLIVARGDTQVTVLYFNTDLASFGYSIGDTVDIAVTLDKNEYMGAVSLSVIARDIKLSSTDNEAMLLNERIFERFSTGRFISCEEARGIMPDRKDFASVYRFIKSAGGFSGKIENIAIKLDIPLGKLRTILIAMQELGLAEVCEGMTSAYVALIEVEGKVDITKAPIIMELREVCL